MRPIAAAALVLAAIVAPALGQADLPTHSYAGAHDGEAAPFDGNWSIMRPDGDPTAATDSCAMPAEISANGSAAIRYRSSTGATFDFALSAEYGVTSWAGELERIAVWRDDDSFMLYPRLAEGGPDLDAPQLYERCPVWPRQSYAGAEPGALEPFLGRWQEAVPPARGAEPLEVVGDCDDPTTFEAAGANALRRIVAGEPERSMRVQARGEETIVPNPIAGFAPSIVVWVSPDRWHFHGLHLWGNTDWTTPVIYIRCPD